MKERSTVLLGIAPSTRSGKKLMAVFEVDGSRKTTHFGSAGYNDYTTYCAQIGKVRADEHKRLYIIRHHKREDWSDPTTAGTLALYVLWSRPTVKASIALYKKTFEL
jgi:hypothetical protein